MNLEINGKEYPLQFGMGAIEMYCDKMDCDVDDIDTHMGSSNKVNQLRAINNLTLCAIQNGCELAKPEIKFDVTYREFQAWLDEQPTSTINNIISHWKDTKTLGVKVSEYYDNEFSEEIEGEAKKVTKKKSQSAK